jgi:predicted DNA-binding transcriptional regulator AlpA
MAKVTTIIQAPPLLVAREDAAAALGKISESTLDDLVRKGLLPPPRKISAGRTGWLWKELQACAESLPVSDNAPGPGRKAA